MHMHMQLVNAAGMNGTCSTTEVLGQIQVQAINFFIDLCCIDILENTLPFEDNITTTIIMSYCKYRSNFKIILR